MPRPFRSNPNTKHKAIKLRKASIPAEIKLWSRIRNDQLGSTFRRQHAIGNYIVDFCAVREKLVIELDGSQHYDQIEYDNERTKYFEALGYHVLRFRNNDVLNDIESVLKVIWSALQDEKGWHKVSHQRVAPPSRAGGQGAVRESKGGCICTLLLLLMASPRTCRRSGSSELLNLPPTKFDERRARRQAAVLNGPRSVAPETRSRLARDCSSSR